MKIRYVAIIIYLLLLPVYVFADGPSFDCRNAKTCIEKFICADKDLSALDKKMSEIYNNLLAKLQGEDKEQIKQNQVRWIKARDERCAEPNMRKDEAQREVEKEAYFEPLFHYLYKERIEELQEWGKYVNGEKTTTYPPWQPMCWKRQELVDRQFWPITGNASVCRAFEQVLNTTCEAPDKLQCNWTLPLGEKGFQKLSWQPLEFNEYKGVVEEMILGKDHKWSWHQKDPEAKKAFDEGRYNVKMAIVDINNSGKTRVIIHISRRKDCPARGTFGIVNLETKQIDWKYEAAALLDLNASEGAEIMLYGSKTYRFGWVPGFKRLFIWDERYGGLCEFKYLKGGEKK